MADTLSQFEYGWEICSTGGRNETFHVTGYSVTVNGTTFGVLRPSIPTGDTRNPGKPVRPWHPDQQGPRRVLSSSLRTGTCSGTTTLRACSSSRR